MGNSPAHLKFGTAHADGVRWHLRRNCSVAPKQLCMVLLGLGAVSMGIAAWFWFLGATLVLPFALFEVAALAVALLVYSKHATDAERISVTSGLLVIEVEHGGVLDRFECLPAWVRVEAPTSSKGLIALVVQGRRVQVGRHVQPDWRPALANEIRRVLRTGGGNASAAVFEGFSPSGNPKSLV